MTHYNIHQDDSSLGRFYQLIMLLTGGQKFYSKIFVGKTCVILRVEHLALYTNNYVHGYLLQKPQQWP